VIKKVIKIVKGGVAIFKAYKKTAVIVAIVLSLASSLTGGYVYMRNHERMKIMLQACQGATYALRDHVVGQNARIKADNKKTLALLLEAKRQHDATLMLVNDLLKENMDLRKQMQQLRFNNVKAIQDDEDFSNWVDIPVPGTAWSLLRDAAEGPSNGGN
jgi:hypothetical protein